MKKFPYEKPRKGQLELINLISENLGKKIFLKAPTGFGKTVVALLSHLKADKVLYAVRTRNEMSPVIRELRRLKEEFTIVFSASKMCPLNSRGNAYEFWLSCKLLRARGLCPYYLRLASTTDEEIIDILMKEKTTDPQALARKVAKSLGACPFFALTGLIPHVKYILVTYPYIFRGEVFETAFDNMARSSFYLIIDEAHTLMNPQMIIDEEIDEFDVGRAIAEARKYKLGKDVMNYLENLEEVLSKIKSTLLKRIEKSLVFPDSTIISLLEDALISLRISKLKKASVTELLSSSSSLGKILRFVRTLSLPSFKVYGYVNKYDVRSLKTLTPELDYVIDTVNLFKGALMMSGTLPSEDIAKNVLFKDAIYIDVERKYGKIFPRYNVFYAVVTSVTSSYKERSRDIYMKYAKMIEELAKGLQSGVILVVYPSYKFMKDVMQYVISEGVRQIAEGFFTTTSDLMNLIGQERLLVHAVAGGKLTEGLEIVANGKSLIKLVIIVGVPYPQPDDYIKDFMKGVMNKTGDKLLAREYIMDVQAGIKVAQAIGRAIRSENDRAFVVLGDRRYLSLRMRKALNIRYDLVTSNPRELVKPLKKFILGYI